MYLDHFSLNLKPFQTTTDPKFLWLGGKHKHVLASLRYGLVDKTGIMLLTGEVGTGKTLLVNYLKSVLEKDTVIATIVDPNLPTIDFYNLLAYEFNWPQTFESEGKFLLKLCNFLYNCYSNQKRVLLVIDESQRLKQSLIEDIRMLSNIEVNNRKLINIFFVGQQECRDLLLRPQNSALTQQLSVHCHIESLDEDETGLYIDHRLKVAGSESRLFSEGAVGEMFRLARGLPRLINIICDQCLLTAYIKGVKQVDDAIVKECAEELRIPGYKPKENAGTFRLIPSVTDQKNSGQMRQSGEYSLVNVSEDVPHQKHNPPSKSPVMTWMAYVVVFALLITGLVYLHSKYEVGMSQEYRQGIPSPEKKILP